MPARGFRNVAADHGFLQPPTKSQFPFDGIPIFALKLELVWDILEGTKPAFDNRSRKYL